MTHHQAGIKYLERLTLEDADTLARNQNPTLRDCVAPIVGRMALRHGNGEWNPDKDAQSCDDIMYYTDVTHIHAALKGKRISRFNGRSPHQ